MADVAVAAGLVSVALLCAGAAVPVWRRRRQPAAVALLVLLLCAAWWNAGYVGEVVSGSLAAKLAWAKFEYVAIAALPVAIVAFAYGHTGQRSPLPARVLVPLCVVPAVLLVGAWTNAAHGLVWSRTEVVVEGSLRLLDVEHGPLFYLGWFHAYLLTFAGSVLLLATRLHLGRHHHRETVLLAVGLAAPWLGNALYVLELTPGPALDYTNVGFAVTGIAFTAGHFRQRMLDIVPVARALLLDHIADGMVVVDRHGLVVDANPAAEPLLACAVTDAVGRPATEVVHAYEGLVPVAPGPVATGGAAPVRTIEVQDAGATRTFDVAVTRVPSGGGDDAGTLLVFHDVTNRERLHAHLAATARTDPLTGLANRRVLAERIDDALRAATRTGLPVGLLLLDLDRFKAINDTLGHPAGDQCLVAVARRLACCIRPGDTAARLGGDEFVVVLPDLESAVAAEAVANRILDCLHAPIEVADEWISVAASVGVHVVGDGSGSADDLLRRADAAMYAAKRDPGRHLVLSAS